MDGKEDDGSEDDDSHQEHAVDVNSIVLPIFTQDLLLFTSVQMISLLNYPVFVKDLRGAICIAEFSWRIFVLLSSILKVRLCRAIIEQGVVVTPHQSLTTHFCKRKMYHQSTDAGNSLTKSRHNICNIGFLWYENELR